MTSHKTQKILLITSTVLLLIQLPWFLITQAIVNKTQIKTTATVIRIESKDAECTGDRPNKPDFTCDHSLKQYPVYRYTDTSGQAHEQDDRFFGEYKQNNPLKKLFWKDVGDTVTAYYTKDKPQEVLFMSGPFAYAAWLIPLYISVPVLMTLLVVTIYNKFHK